MTDLYAITLETEEDLIGNEFMQNGELTLKLSAELKGYVQLSHGSSVYEVNMQELQLALEYFSKRKEL